jgi:Uma2 family endonuclease
MSALTVDHEPDNGHGYDWDELVRIWEETDGPEGWKVEVIEGIVTMAPPPANDHNFTASALHRLLYTVIPDDWDVYQTQGVSVPGRKGLYIPDLAVIPKTALKAPGHHVPASEAKLVVEITSEGNAAQDRVAKLRAYAHAGVPLYLLLDAWHSGSPTASLYGQPEAGTYRLLSTVEYGEEIRLPEPFDLAIDTALFPVS